MKNFESPPSHAGRSAALIVNSRSRRGSEWFLGAKERLTAGGIHLVEAQATLRPSHVERFVRRHIQDGTPLIIVGGGDGTMSSVAHLFASQGAQLGVLPMGTGNAFARDLGIPSQVEAACHTILEGKVAHVDMGKIGNRSFVNVATMGLSTKIALGLTDTMKKRIGRLVYLVSLYRALAVIKPFRVQLELPEEQAEFDCLQLVIGNGHFHAGPFPITPEASITGGWLSLYALASRRKIDFLRMALRMRGGRHVDLAEVKTFRLQSGRIVTHPIQRVTVDGETSMRTPVKFETCPGALKVLVPDSFHMR